MTTTPKKKTAYWIWLAVTLAATALFLFTLVGLYFSGDALNKKALAEGQMLRIDIETGKVEGKIISSTQEPELPRPDPNAKPVVEAPAPTIGKTGEHPQPEHVTPSEDITAPAEDATTPAPETANPVAPTVAAPTPEEKTPSTEAPAPATATTPEVAPAVTEPATTPEATPDATPQEHPEAATTPTVAAPTIGTPAVAPAVTAPTTAPEAVPESDTATLGHTLGKPREPVRTVPPGINSLPPAPVPELVQKTEKGLELPIASDSTTPWQQYRKPAADTGKAAKIAIVVTGLGHNRAVAEAAIALPEAVTCSFSPYAKDTPVFAKNARSLGHEVLLDVPMEPADYPTTDPGPYALLTVLTAEENITRLHWALSRFAGFIGVLTPVAEKFSVSDKAMKPIREELKKRGLVLLLGSTGGVSAGGGLTLKADMILDNTLTAESINSQLAALEKLAAKNGQAIAIAHAYPLSLSRIKEWADAPADKRGWVLVPVSSLVNE